jgi:hypothetical protein
MDKPTVATFKRGDRVRFEDRDSLIAGTFVRYMGTASAIIRANGTDYTFAVPVADLSFMFPTLEPRACLGCGKPFTPADSNETACSRACVRAYVIRGGRR